MDFKVGDIVTLKSGGPLMTVSAAGSEDRVQVVWFNREGDNYERKMDHFPSGCLRKAGE